MYRNACVKLLLISRQMHIDTDKADLDDLSTDLHHRSTHHAATTKARIAVRAPHTLTAIEKLDHCNTARTAIAVRGTASVHLCGCASWHMGRVLAHVVSHLGAVIGCGDGSPIRRSGGSPRTFWTTPCDCVCKRAPTSSCSRASGLVLYHLLRIQCDL